MVKLSSYHSFYRKLTFLSMIFLVIMLFSLFGKADKFYWNLYNGNIQGVRNANEPEEGWNENKHDSKEIITEEWNGVQTRSQILSGQKPGLIGYQGAMSAEVARTVPLIYVITPTYARAQQKAELTRLSYTLRNVERLHWIVVEDATNKTRLVTQFLRNCKVPHTHLNVHERPPEYPYSRRKGGSQRNKALGWIYKHAELPSVVYFADDDNTYDLQVFEEMRYTTKVSVWPVGFAGGVKFETPAVKDGKVIGWAVGFNPDRTFGVDMAGFAVSTAYLLEMGKPTFSRKPPERLLELNFFAKLNVTLEDLEPKADNCSKVLVWHTQTKTPSFGNMRKQIPSLEKYSVPDMEV